MRVGLHFGPLQDFAPIGKFSKWCKKPRIWVLTPYYSPTAYLSPDFMCTTLYHPRPRRSGDQHLDYRHLCD